MAEPKVMLPESGLIAEGDTISLQYWDPENGENTLTDLEVLQKRTPEETRSNKTELTVQGLPKSIAMLRETPEERSTWGRVLGLLNGDKVRYAEVKTVYTTLENLPERLSARKHTPVYTAEPAEESAAEPERPAWIDRVKDAWGEGEVLELPGEEGNTYVNLKDGKKPVAKLVDQKVKNVPYAGFRTDDFDKHPDNVVVNLNDTVDNTLMLEVYAAYSVIRSVYNYDYILQVAKAAGYNTVPDRWGFYCNVGQMKEYRIGEQGNYPVALKFDDFTAFVAPLHAT